MLGRTIDCGIDFMDRQNDCARRHQRRHHGKFHAGQFTLIADKAFEQV